MTHDADELHASWRRLAARGEPVEIGFSRTRSWVELVGAGAVVCVALWLLVVEGIVSTVLVALIGVVWGATAAWRLRATGPAVVMSDAGVWSAGLELLVPWDVIGEARSAGKPSVVLMVDKAWAREHTGHLSSLRRYAIETGRHELAELPLARRLDVPDSALAVWISVRAQQR